MAKHLRGRTRQPRRAPLPLFADPWRFRDTGIRTELVAGLSGEAVSGRRYCRGGRWVVAVMVDAEVTRESPPARSMLKDLLRRKSATMARYRNAGICTAIELITIEALWFGDLSLRALARHDGVTPAAIEARISGLARKAPEFVHWWQLKNRCRRR